MESAKDTTRLTLTELREEISGRLAQVKSRAEALEHQLEAINTTLALLDAPLSARLEVSDPSPNVTSNLSGMTQAEALVALAKSNGGKVRIVDAHKEFRKIGLIKETKNWYNILFNAATKSGKLTRCGPGEYELTPEENQSHPVLRFGTK